jgi:hypothetical protein
MSVSLNDFKRLRPELVRLRRNQPALDSEARAVVERLPAETLAAMDRWAESERQRRRQVEWDIQVLGQAARTTMLRLTLTTFPRRSAPISRS